jgi:hypothetical protein
MIGPVEGGETPGGIRPSAGGSIGEVRDAIGGWGQV